MNQFLVLPLAILLACSAGGYAATYTCADTVSVSMSTTSYEFTASPYGLNDDSDPMIFYVAGRTELDYAEYEALDTSCKSDETTGLDFSFNLGDCDGFVTANDTHINYQYYIWQKPMGNETGNPVISRYESHSIRFDCHYSRIVTDETTENYIVPNVIHTHYFNGRNLHEGTFTYRFGFANSSSIDDQADGAVVDVDDWMYLRAQLEDGSMDSSNYISFKECTAHDTASNSSSSHHYHLIRNYCVHDETWDEAGSIMLETSGTEYYAEFKVKAFVWNDDAYAQHRQLGSPFNKWVSQTENQIYVTCDITVCNNDAITQGTYSTMTCDDHVSTCGSLSTNRRRRRRRSAAGETQQVISLMAGPMSVN